MFNWFKKAKKEKVLITTNPPAREIALANRNKKRFVRLEKIKKDIILDINHNIDYGAMELVIYGTNNRESKSFARSLSREKYLVCRELRKAGFNVTTNTVIETQPQSYDSRYNIQRHLDPPIINYRTDIKISWK